MNKLTKAMAIATAAALIGFGGWATTSANAATNDEIANYLAEAVAAQLGIANSDTLRQLIADAMANNLLAPAVTDAAGNSVDGVSSLTAEELAALLDSNLTTQLATIEQTLIDLGVNPDPSTPVDPPVVVEEDDDDAYEEDDDAYEEDDDAYEDDDEDDAYEDDEDDEDDEDESDDEDDSDDESDDED